MATRAVEDGLVNDIEHPGREVRFELHRCLVLQDLFRSAANRALQLHPIHQAPQHFCCGGIELGGFDDGDPRKFEVLAHHPLRGELRPQVYGALARHADAI
jgi:hypothetical protein